ncbi:MAG: EF-Tu/IF-2/RF-3 family GTPase [Parcubacteria group bacterium]
MQAQTLANLYLAVEQGLEIIPVINKIDLPASNVEQAKQEIKHLVGCTDDEILLCSAKTGVGVIEILDRIIEKVPAPKGKADEPLRALIFDSFYDEYRGVVAYVRVVDGEIKKGDKLSTSRTKADIEVLECGVLKPKMNAKENLLTGEIGYVVTGLKEIEKCRVGDTIMKTEVGRQKSGQTAEGGCQNSARTSGFGHQTSFEPLPGYKEVKPMVYAGIFCKEGSEYSDLREAIGKLKLNDAALIYEPESSPVLGIGFRCGFLGLLHLEIFHERLLREFGLDVVITTPSVAYKVVLKSGQRFPSEVKSGQIISDHEYIMKNPSEFPDLNCVERVEEPLMSVDIVTPMKYMGGIMELVKDNRGEYLGMEYIASVGLTGQGADARLILHYRLPLAMLIVDFYDKLKTVSSGYASMNYDFFAYRPADLIKMDILVAEEPVEAFANIVYRDDAFKVGKKIVETLKEKIPRQQFVVKIQAALGGKIIAAERISALRKDVTQKLYGGDWTRRAKLLERQKKGKKELMGKSRGKVDIPTEAFLAVMKR